MQNIKVRHLEDSIYQVVELYYEDDYYLVDEDVLFQGSLTECEAYIRLRKENLLG